MRNKTLWIATAMALALAVMAFSAGWLFGAGDRPRAPAAPAPALPVVAAADDLGPAGMQLDAIRRGVPIGREAVPPPLAKVDNADLKRERAYPMQPPTIPHSIDGYQVDKNSNRCMLCHARANAATFQAPPVSVTHYMDRDDQFLAAVSPRRYFCNQCHVVQTDARPLVGNAFEDVDRLLHPPAGD